MKICIALAFLVTSRLALADPLITSWITDQSGSYARSYLSEADRRAGKSSTTWSNFHLSQTLPAYCGVQEISYSADWVYIRTTGLGDHVMGPWFFDAAKSRPFVNLPVNQKRLFRLPRHPVVPEEKAQVRGDIGFFVDGVHGYDASDATSYSTAQQRDGDPPGRPGGLSGDRVWNRDAFLNEAVTFDAALAHQQNTGDYHYHANPVAPRHRLGDHVDFDAAAGVYRESAGPPSRHSPIVGWALDGFPIYGPYGFSRPRDAASGLRRMVSGYVPRDGRHGTVSLAANGRHTLPAWAARAKGREAALSPAQYGPNVSSTYPLGRYLEDNEYLGDLDAKQGTDFDLDEHNGRFGVTPEYPGGTYAYFVTIAADGTPLFPYNLGRSYHGLPSGGEVREIDEPVTTVFSGGPAMTEKVLSSTANGAEVTLVWSSVEGGTYRVESGAAVSAAAVFAASAAAQTSYTLPATSPDHAAASYRVARTGLAPYDPVARPKEGSGILSVSPDHAPPGQPVTLSIRLDPTAFPPPPPPHAPVLKASLGTLAGAERRHVSRTEVTATFAIPPGAPPGPQPVSVTFPGPPDHPQDSVTYTLPAAFTVEPPVPGDTPK